MVGVAADVGAGAGVLYYCRSFLITAYRTFDKLTLRKKLIENRKFWNKSTKHIQDTIHNERCINHTNVFVIKHGNESNMQYW